MIVGWSRHTGGGDPTEPCRYLIASSVRKDAGLGHRTELRHPRPELLLGDPALLQAWIGALPFRRRAGVLTASFAAADVDVEAFNDGAPELRRQVTGVIELVGALVHAGVPKPSRLPLVVATHTHLGRLEVNVAFARALDSALDGRGIAGDRLRAINPHPPGAASRREWDALEDLANGTFGWTSPRDGPAPVRIAGWVRKQYAATRRLGVPIGPDLPQLYVWDGIETALEAGRLRRRSDLVALVARRAEACGWVVDAAPDALRIAPPGGRGLRLTGALLGSPRPQPMPLASGEAARVLRAAWLRRARDHRRRLGLPPPDPGEAPDPRALLQRPSLVLPPAHPDRAACRPWRRAARRGSRGTVPVDPASWPSLGDYTRVAMAAIGTALRIAAGLGPVLVEMARAARTPAPIPNIMERPDDPDHPIRDRDYPDAGPGPTDGGSDASTPPDGRPPRALPRRLLGDGGNGGGRGSDGPLHGDPRPADGSGTGPRRTGRTGRRDRAHPEGTPGLAPRAGAPGGDAGGPADAVRARPGPRVIDVLRARRTAPPDTEHHAPSP
jgi:hypothetical protein